MHTEEFYLHLWNMTDKSDQEMYGSYEEFKKFVDDIHNVIEHVLKNSVEKSDDVD
jgi:hypothetical protein